MNIRKLEGVVGQLPLSGALKILENREIMEIEHIGTQSKKRLKILQQTREKATSIA
jgi:hypothetical protein